MSAENPESQEFSYKELLDINQMLRSEVDALTQQRAYYWDLYAETSRKLQVYSASIKAAVSSLLNYDIFWDSANQHEFLETINSSVNQVSALIVLLTLAFRAEAGNLALKRDPQVIQEILAVAAANARTKLPEMNLKITLPVEGKLALVDYEYLSMALSLLFEVIQSRIITDQVSVTASEGSKFWFLDFSGFDDELMRTIEKMHLCKTQPATIDILMPENILRLHIACEVFHLQEILVEVVETPDRRTVLRLWVPTVAQV